MTALPTQSPRQRRMLALPAELRNRIYELDLNVQSEDETVTIKGRSTHGSSFYSVLSILETCRTINAKGRALFYCLNRKLSFTSSTDIISFAVEQDLSTLQQVQHAEMDESNLHRLNFLSSPSFWEAVLLLPGLETLHVEVDIVAVWHFRQAAMASHEVVKVMQGLRTLRRLEVEIEGAGWTHSFVFVHHRVLNESIPKLWAVADEGGQLETD